MRSRPAASVSAALLGLALAVGSARAQFSLDFDTSIRAAGMGGAGAAVMWGEPGVWANPATLAGVHGVGWVAGYTHILPDLFDGAEFSSQRMMLGGSGLGVSLMGEPISGLGKARLDFGTFGDPFGSGPISPFEETKGWGVAISPLRLFDALRRSDQPNVQRLTDRGEIAFGYQSKTTRAGIEESSETFDVGDTYDWGVTGRLALARLLNPEAPFRLDLSGAYSEANHSDAESSSGGDSLFAFGPTRLDRVGVALHLSPAPPSQRTATPPSLPWWRPGDVPEISFGLAYDHEQRKSVPSGFTNTIQHYGLEVSVFRLLAFRIGYHDDKAGEVQGMTYGGGVTLPIGPWASIGYDIATVPQVEGIDRQVRQGWSAWLDPLRIFNGAR